MYRLYEEKCKAVGKKAQCYETYRKSFKSFKLKFHNSKKDLCKVCVAYEASSEEEKHANREAFDAHQKRKKAARMKKKKRQVTRIRK